METFFVTVSDDGTEDVLPIILQFINNKQTGKNNEIFRYELLNISINRMSKNIRQIFQAQSEH